MSKLYSIILILIGLIGCTEPDSLTMDDFSYLIQNTNATSSFDNNNMHLYSGLLQRANKLEEHGLIKVKVGEMDFDNKSVLYIDMNVTDLGKAVIDKINNKNNTSTDIPSGLLKKIHDIETGIFKGHKLNLRQYIFLTQSTSGDIGAPGEEVLTREKETIKLVKYLSSEGYMEYSIYDDTFNGKPAKNFRWWPTQKGIEFNAN